MSLARRGPPAVRGALTPDRPLADLTWLRVGGPAEWLFQPADIEDLREFLKRAAAGSSGVSDRGRVEPDRARRRLARGGGAAGARVQRHRGGQGRVRAGAAALDAHVARRAAEAGIDLTFLRTIPGAIGGAVRMNAGCYGIISPMFSSRRRR